jgi:hypothetical protein
MCGFRVIATTTANYGFVSRGGLLASAQMMLWMGCLAIGYPTSSAFAAMVILTCGARVWLAGCP